MESIFLAFFRVSLGIGVHDGPRIQLKWRFSKLFLPAFLVCYISSAVPGNIWLINPLLRHTGGHMVDNNPGVIKLPILGKSNNTNLWQFSGISLIRLHCLGW